MRILSWYILIEQLKVFVLAVVATILVMNFGAMLIFLQQYPLPIGSLLKVLPYRTPLMLPWILPLALLMSTTLTYGRLASDNEILAIQMAGMHLMRPVLPALALGVAVSLGLVVVNDRVLPWCRQQEYETYIAESEQILLNTFQTQSMLRGGDYLLLWEDCRGRTLYNITVRQREGDAMVGDYRASSATFDTDGEKITLVLKNPSGKQFKEGMGGSLAEVTRQIPLDGVFVRPPGAKALNTREMLREAERLYGSERPLPMDAKAADVERAWRSDKMRSMWLRVHQRFSLAFSALAFALVGVAMGLLARQSHMLSAFFLGVLPVMLLYYPVFLLGHALASEGSISAAAACWTPAGLLGAIGVGLLGWLFLR